MGVKRKKGEVTAASDRYENTSTIRIFNENGRILLFAFLYFCLFQINLFLKRVTLIFSLFCLLVTLISLNSNICSSFLKDTWIRMILKDLITLR